MKHQNNTVMRMARAAIACSAFALLAACGGGSGDVTGGQSTQPPPGGVRLQVVSFGDSLSDVGTYAVTTQTSPGPLALGGGRFTTNPGQVWTQNVAQYYGDTLKPAFLGGFGVPLTAAGGLGYAEGGATVNTVVATDNSNMTAVPVTTQVQSYLQAHGSFNSNQLVLVWAGGTDVLDNVEAFSLGQISQQVMVQNVQNAAITFAQTIGQILQAGATKVVVVNQGNAGLTPLGASSADGGASLTQLSGAFNATLKGALAQAGIDQKVIQIDVFTWMSNLVANYQANGFKVATGGTACNLQKMIAAATAAKVPNPASFGTALLCSPDTYTEPNADQTYMFADQFHPTTRMHQLFAQFAEQQVAAHGIGK